MAITKNIFQSGSFGVFAPGPNSNGKPVTIWFCGAWLVNGVKAPQPVSMGNASTPCVHRTRAQAVKCSKLTQEVK